MDAAGKMPARIDAACWTSCRNAKLRRAPETVKRTEFVGSAHAGPKRHEEVADAGIKKKGNRVEYKTARAMGRAYRPVAGFAYGLANFGAGQNIPDPETFPDERGRKHQAYQ